MKKTKRKSILITVLFSALMVLSSFATVMSSTDAEVQDQVSTFLTKVAGLNEDNLSFSSLNISRSTLMGSNIPQTKVNAIIISNNQNFTLTITIVNNKIVFYVLDSLQGSIDDDEQFSIEESLNGVKKSLQAYETNFGATHIKEFEQAIPSSLTANDYISEKQNARLEINYSDSSKNIAEYASFLWVQKIGETEVPNLSVTLTVNKNGMVTRFFDNTELYKVVIADSVISEEEAMNIGQEFIQKYCEENNRKIVSIESKFHYVRDLKSKRGDIYTIYPQWTISAEFEGVNKEGAYGYSVLIWADTGEAHHHAAQGMFLPSVTESTPNTIYLVMAGIAVIIVALPITVFSQKRKSGSKKNKVKSSIFKNTTVITIIVLLCSLPLCQICSASPSYIYGSRHGLPGVETTTDSNLAGNLTLASNYAGFTTNNWYGSSTTASNLYVGAYGGYSDFSISFHVGHGDISGWMCWTWPFHYHSNYFMYADSGTNVKDTHIYYASVDENPNSEKFVYIWSCHLGEAPMGEVIEYVCGDEERGMPLAWIHDDGLSLDGYNSPDNSGQVYIGFTGLAHWLSSTVWDVEEMGFMFLLYFYWATLCDDATVNGALNVASNELFGVTYGNCNLDNGYVLSSTQSRMAVYGQGTIYLEP